MMPHAQTNAHGCGCGPHQWGPTPRCCRKESKELLVEGKADPKANVDFRSLAYATLGQTANDATAQMEIGTAIIGGGCCVQLSVEYMPAAVSLADQKCGVVVEVTDSEGTAMMWVKVFTEGYHVKECIITTYPGAKLKVMVANAIARVRWCEIFSC